MSEEVTGHVRHEIFGHVLKITIDNAKKKNAITPEMMAELSDALTLLDRSDDLWVGVLCAAGGHFTAGLDMPKFFGPGATVKPLPEARRQSPSAAVAARPAGDRGTSLKARARAGM